MKNSEVDRASPKAKLANTLSILATLSALIALPPSAWAQSPSQCPGPIKQSHPYGTFDFETNSRVEKAPYLDFSSGIVSCVANADQVLPVYVHWLTPNLRGWAPPKGKGLLESVSRLITNEKVTQIKGCLEYGNRGDMTHAFFFGTAQEQKAVDNEVVRGCKDVAANPKAPEDNVISKIISKLENILLKFKNYIPSDSKKPNATLLQIEGHVGVRTIAPDRYTSFFTYRIGPFEGSPDGIITNITFRPAFRGPTEALLSSFLKTNSEITRVNKNGEGEISFEVSDMQSPVLHYASYEMYDQNERIVGAIDFPVFVSSQQQQQQNKKPNIIVVMGDSIGWANIGVYNQGIMSGKTPNLDTLALQGLRFTDYYAETSGTAGQANFITGQLPIRTGLTTIGEIGSAIGIPDAAPTIATVLQSMGYATGQFGNSRLGDRNQFLPTLHGFDEFFGYLYPLHVMEGPCSRTYPPTTKDTLAPRNMLRSWGTSRDDPTVDPRWGKVGKQRIEDVGELCPNRMKTVDDEILSHALTFIDKASSDKKPFFVWLNPTRMNLVTHLSEKYESRRTPENGWSIQEAGMAQLDDIVGSVMQRLRNLAIDDATIVVFSTNNGAENLTWPDGGQTPFAGSRGTAFEGGFRVPMIIRWPGKVPAGKIENSIVSGLDWLPTLVAAAGNPNIVEELQKGKKISDRTYKVRLDGNNQMALITGNGPSSRNEIWYFVGTELAAVRIGDFKHRFTDQAGSSLSSTPKVLMPIVTNLRLDPYERTGPNQSLSYFNWYLSESWRLVIVQQELAKLSQTFREYPPMQQGVSFNVEAVRAQIVH